MSGSLRLNGSTSGFSEITAPDVAGDQTFTLPAVGGTLSTVPYQQGLWIPTMTVGTNTNNPDSNYWTRIGNLVTLNGYLNDWTDHTTVTNIGIEGRPYTWTVGQCGGACMGTRVAVAISSVFLGNDGTFTLYESSSSTGATWIGLKYSNTNTASQIQFRVSYITDDTTFAPINGATIS